MFVAESPVWAGTPQTLLTYICGLVGPTPANQSTLGTAPGIRISEQPQPRKQQPPPPKKQNSLLSPQKQHRAQPVSQNA